MKLSFDLFGKRHILALHSITKPSVWTSGVTSRVFGTNMHILLMDYDSIREDYLLRELEFLQHMFELGNFYVFRTRIDMMSEVIEVNGLELETSPIGGYHAYCIDIDTIRSNMLVLRSSGSDYAFINAPSYNPEKHWVLRLVDKGKRGAPEYITTVESPFEGKTHRLQSTFHARLLEDYTGLEIESTLGNPDGNPDGVIDHYVTGKRVE